MNAEKNTSGEGVARTVLLVEDHEPTRVATADMLRTCGCRVLEADAAETALQVLRTRDISLLMVDVGLPGESGLVFAARARQMRPLLPIVLVTGDDLPDDSPGGNGPVLLRKPYGIDALRTALGEAAAR
jgi:CheY-like chemotaxis protein